MRARGVRRRVEDGCAAQDRAEHAGGGSARKHATRAAACGRGTDHNTGRGAGRSARRGTGRGSRAGRTGGWTRCAAGVSAAAEAAVPDADTGDPARFRGCAVA